VPSIYEVVEDVDAAIARYDQAASPALQRRAMREALAHLYFLHQYRLREAEAFSKAVADSDGVGQVTQGVIYARGKLAHHVTREFAPQRQGGDFDPDDFDMRDFYAGTLNWLRLEEMTPEDQADFVKTRDKYGRANLEHYRLTVAGRPVRDTLAVARDFLVAPPGLVPLSPVGRTR
jgi:hypothetical protein